MARLSAGPRRIGPVEVRIAGRSHRPSVSPAVTPNFPATSCPDLFHCCPVKMGWPRYKALVQAGFRPFRRIGTRIASRRPPPSLSPRCHPGLDPGSSLSRTALARFSWTPEQVRGDNRGAETIPPVGTEPVPKLNRTAVDLFQASTSCGTAVRAGSGRGGGGAWMPGTSPGMTHRGQAGRGSGRRHARGRRRSYLPAARLGDTVSRVARVNSST